VLSSQTAGLDGEHAVEEGEPLTSAAPQLPVRTAKGISQLKYQAWMIGDVEEKRERTTSGQNWGDGLRPGNSAAAIGQVGRAETGVPSSARRFQGRAPTRCGQQRGRGVP